MNNLQLTGPGEETPVREQAPLRVPGAPRRMPVAQQGVDRTPSHPVRAEMQRVVQYQGRSVALLVRGDVESQLRTMATGNVTLPMLWQALETIAIYEATTPGEYILDRRTVDRLNALLRGNEVNTLVLVTPDRVRGIIESPQMYLRGAQVGQGGHSVRDVPVNRVLDFGVGPRLGTDGRDQARRQLFKD